MEATLEALTNAVKGKVGQDAGLRATLRFDLTDLDASIFIDGHAVPNVVSNEPKEAETVIKIKASNLAKMFGGDLNPMMAYMMGKLKIEGNMATAMSLTKLI